MSANRDFRYTIIFFRFVIASIILIVNTALFGLGRAPVFFLIAGIYLLTIIYSVLLLAKIAGPGFFYTQIILDLAVETLLVHYTGGINSVLGILFPLSIFAAGIIISPRASLVTAFLASFFYAALISLSFFDVIPPAHGERMMMESSYVFALLYFRVAIFCVIGFLSSYIAQQSHKKDVRVMTLEAKLQREDRLSAIGKFAASAAHEIRNPLASISGCVESLKDSLPADKDNNRLFDLILKETARLNNIINGLLEYVKPRRINPEKVLLKDLLEEVVFLVKNAKEFRREVEISEEYKSPDLKITCDPQQIKQVFFNLLVNAIEAVSGREKAKVRVSVEQTGAELAIIEFRDNGPGIPEKNRETLFEPFASGKESGIGLGLAIAMTIVREHRGNIEVETAMNKGTVFRVIMPVNYKNK